MYEKYIVLLVFNNSRKTVNVKSILFYSSFSCPSNLMMKKEVVGETTVYRKSPINIEVYIHAHTHLYPYICSCTSNTSHTCIGNSGESKRPTYKDSQPFLLGYKNSSDSTGFSWYIISISVTGNVSITVCSCFILVLFSLCYFLFSPLIHLINIY